MSQSHKTSKVEFAAPWWSSSRVAWLPWGEIRYMPIVGRRSRSNDPARGHEPEPSAGSQRALESLAGVLWEIAKDEHNQRRLPTTSDHPMRKVGPRSRARSPSNENRQ